MYRTVHGFFASFRRNHFIVLSIRQVMTPVVPAAAYSVLFPHIGEAYSLTVPEGIRRELIGDKYRSVLPVGQDYSIFTLNFARSATHEEIVAGICHVIQTNVWFHPRLVVRVPELPLLKLNALKFDIRTRKAPQNTQVIILVGEEASFFNSNQEGSLTASEVSRGGNSYATEEVRHFLIQGTRGNSLSPYPNLSAIMSHTFQRHKKVTPSTKRMTPEKLARQFGWGENPQKVEQFLAGDPSVFDPIVFLSIGTSVCLPELAPFLSLVAVYVYPDLMEHCPEVLTTGKIRLCREEDEPQELLNELRSHPKPPKEDEDEDFIRWLARHPALLLRMSIVDETGQVVMMAQLKDYVALYRDYLSGRKNVLLRLIR